MWFQFFCKSVNFRLSKNSFQIHQIYKESHYMTSVESQMRHTKRKRKGGERNLLQYGIDLQLWTTLILIQPSAQKLMRKNLMISHLKIIWWLNLYLVQCGKNTRTLRPCTCQYCACNAADKACPSASSLISL